MNAVISPTLAREGEADFGFHELFFSRTDTRGVILSGNEVFRRVSGYGWNDLLGAPHKVVRHPDTPRGMFRILWNALGNGNPMGGYVKNRARNGEYYWVFAVLLPAPGGFLSVRMKPSTPLFARVREVYAELSQRERTERLDPDQGAKALRDFAASEGFSSYTSFMASAMGQELAARDAKLGRLTDVRTTQLIALNTSLEEVSREQRNLLRSFEALQSVPNNMRIIASRLEPSGGPVSAISENYRSSSQVISERLRSFVAGQDNLCDRVSRQASKALFLIGAYRVLSEMRRNFDDAMPVPGIDWAHERQMLTEIEAQAQRDTGTAMEQAIAHAEVLGRASAEIRRQMLGLDTIRVLGRVETGRMRGTNSHLSATIDQLDVSHSDIRLRLETIMRLSEGIGTTMRMFQRTQRGA
ncbi:aerotaxis receptor [Rhodobacter viridis]|uniref:Aerotaxis receptor n=1 Tax=Rhodobacter viridis TaxID=1054202 RepID=A0A318U1A5_9RHOB|nr:PAS domain-containing protein [Rhodobacter viridis]PYF10913.1 aerotaxis receptor [Rhodobacter viridis]